jgi:Fe-S-cluster containining protein
MTDDDLEAGDFSTWLHDAGQGRSGDVPCNGCTACCTSSQFVHIGPEETDTLAHIPVPLLFPAPGLPAGHVLLGYDDHGRCPMLVDGRCSIYDHRPKTCRTYDCRVFAAAGNVPEGKPLIADRVSRWRFREASDRARAQHDAVRSAADFLRDRGGMNATRVALAALQIHHLFVDGKPAAADVEAAINQLSQPSAPGSPASPSARPPR